MVHARSVSTPDRLRRLGIAVSSLLPLLYRRTIATGRGPERARPLSGTCRQIGRDCESVAETRSRGSGERRSLEEATRLFGDGRVVLGTRRLRRAVRLLGTHVTSVDEIRELRSTTSRSVRASSGRPTSRNYRPSPVEPVFHAAGPIPTRPENRAWRGTGSARDHLVGAPYPGISTASYVVVATRTRNHKLYSAIRNVLRTGKLATTNRAGRMGRPTRPAGRPGEKSISRPRNPPRRTVVSPRVRGGHGRMAAVPVPPSGAQRHSSGRPHHHRVRLVTSTSGPPAVRRPDIADRENPAPPPRS